MTFGAIDLPTAEVWDEWISRLGGHLLQSWRWGEFKSAHGWTVVRVAVGPDRPAAMAQVLFRQRGPFEIAYIPRGPAHDGRSQEAMRELLRQIDEVCRRRRTLYLIVEPDRGMPFTGSIKQEGFVRGPEHIQPSRTVKVPLLDDDALLAQMHQKTRYSVRLAQRRGVMVETVEPDDGNILSFYELLLDTSARNDFGIHDQSYYSDFLRTFGRDSVLMFANVDGERAAGLIAARFGAEAIYMYGGSSSVHRAHGAAFFLQFEAMRWARLSGSTVYDLWGIPKEDQVAAIDPGEQIAGSKGDDWRGLYKFKVGFGGTIVTYPSTLERRYHPYLGFIARHVSATHG